MSAVELLATIEDGFARFEQEFNARRAILTQRHQLFRLSQHYQQTRRRLERRQRQGPRAWLAENRAWAEEHFMFDASSMQPVGSSLNADIALREHPLLAGAIGVDLSSGKITLKAPLPFDFWESFAFDMRPLTKGDVTGIQQFLQRLGLTSIDRADVEAAVQRIARENAWRPQI